jgi:N-acyl homoserine lactone hydrolase
MRLASLVVYASMLLTSGNAPTQAQQGSPAQQGKPGLERLYVINCGVGRTPDQSRWSPGVNVGVPLDAANNCYLIRHAQGLLLFDTGIADITATMPEGHRGRDGAPDWRLPKTLAAQLAEIGVRPAEIRYLALSHRSPDHAGNVDLFSKSTLLIQKTEYERAPTPTMERLPPEQPAVKLDGDYDVFGDGSVVLVSTPGHSPGHQSMLVRLPKTGPVLLAADAAHFQDNWVNRRVPRNNFDRQQTVDSMERLARLVAGERAQLWINHDKPQSDAQKHAPDYYE